MFAVTVILNEKQIADIHDRIENRPISKLSDCTTQWFYKRFGC